MSVVDDGDGKDAGPGTDGTEARPASEGRLGRRGRETPGGEGPRARVDQGLDQPRRDIRPCPPPPPPPLVFPPPEKLFALCQSAIGPPMTVDMGPLEGEHQPVHSIDAATHVFGFELESLATLSAMGRRRRGYPRDFRRRKAELLAAVLGTGTAVELRILSRPDPAAFTRGQVGVSLLFRHAGLEAEAASLAREVHRLLRASFPEYVFRAVAADQVLVLLDPFCIRTTIELRRRVAWHELDTRSTSEGSRIRLGFAPPAAKGAESAAETTRVLNVFPFTPAGAEMNRLFELFLMNPAPVCLSVRVEPTALADGEARYLESQIRLSESHAQTGLLVSSDLHAVRPTLRVQARDFERLLSRLRGQLERAAALVRVRLASVAPLPETLVHGLGTLLSPLTAAPQGDRSRVLQYGGYETERSAAADGRWLLWEQEAAPRHPKAPAAAGRLPFLFSLEDAAATFLLPPAPRRAALGVTMHGSRELAPPRGLREDGLLLGRIHYRGATQDLRVTEADRQQHVYVCGQTGTGKSTLLATMVLADIQRGSGVALVDPHGDLYREVLRRIPESRGKDVVLLDPTDTEWPVGLNPLEVLDGEERFFVIDGFVSLMERILQDQYGLPALREFAGPMFWQQVRMNLALLTHHPERTATLLDLCAVFQENGYWKRFLPLHQPDPRLRRWVENFLPRMDYLRHTGDNGSSWGAYISSKFENFLFFPPLRNIFGQPRSSIDLRTILDEGKILLVNLAKGALTPLNARFLGMALLAKLQAVLMRRGEVGPEHRRPFHLYVDEFGALATLSFTSLLSEGRKFGISLTLANQFLGQIPDESVREGIFGNVGTIVAFRTGHDDAERLAREFYPGPSPRDFVNLPNWRAYTRAMVDGKRVAPFVLGTEVLPPVLDATVTRRVVMHSRLLYARPRPEVEREILGGDGVGIAEPNVADTAPRKRVVDGREEHASGPGAVTAD